MAIEGSNAIDHWLRAVATTEQALASLIWSTADKINAISVDNAPAIAVCEELRKMVIEILNLSTERQKWIYETIKTLSV